MPHKRKKGWSRILRDKGDKLNLDMLFERFDKPTPRLRNPLRDWTPEDQEQHRKELPGKDET